MKKLLAYLVATAVLLALCMPLVPALRAAETTGTDADIQAVLQAETGRSGASSVQDFLDTCLTDHEGISAEWFALALSRYGSYDFTAYAESLRQYLAAASDSPVATRLKYALVQLSLGQMPDLDGLLNEDALRKGLMTLVFGLHIETNLPADPADRSAESAESPADNSRAAAESTESPADNRRTAAGSTDSQVEYRSTRTIQMMLTELQNAQLPDGGWAIVGQTGDVDVTAMVLQALAPYRTQQGVRAAVDAGLAFLSGQLSGDGTYASFGVSNCESTAQVLLALSSLNIDAAKDPRFRSQEVTLFDGLNTFRTDDGLYSHTVGSPSSDTATAQVLCALVAYLRFSNGQTPFYVFPLQDVPTVVPSPSGAPETATPTPSGAADSGQSGANSASDSGQSGANVASDSGTSDTFSIGPYSGALLIAAAVIALIFLLFGISSLVRRRGQFRGMAISLIAAVICIALLPILFPESADERNARLRSPDGAELGRVTLSVTCQSVAGRSDDCPADGILLAETDVVLYENDTVFRLTERLLAAENIPLTVTGRGKTVYVKGIGPLKEFDFGDLSGWKLRINGTDTSVGSGACIPADGDRIEWYYVTEQ